MVQRVFRYEEPQPTDRAEAEAVFRSGDAVAICRTLVGVALYDPDRRWMGRWTFREFCQCSVDSVPILRSPVSSRIQWTTSSSISSRHEHSVN